MKWKDKATESQQKWMMIHAKSRLLKMLRKAELDLLKEKYKARGAIKEAGGVHAPWASYFWRQGKKFQGDDGGIRVLRNLDTDEIKTEEGIKEIIRGIYERNMGKRRDTG